MKQFLLAWLALSMAAVLAETPRALSFGNETIRRQFSFENGRMRTVLLEDVRTGLKLPVLSEEFRLHLSGGKVINASEFRVEMAKASARRLAITLRHSALGLIAEETYRIEKADPFMRKTVRLRVDANPALLRDIDLECFETEATTDLGGRGQPIYVAGSFFFGLEYPAGFNFVDQGKVVLRHFPGKNIGKTFWSSKTAVIGTGGPDAFMKYVDGIRLPPRSYLLYNSWYDLRRKEMTNERFIDTYKQFRKGLAAYGVHLNAFVPDDGWQDRQSIWQTDKAFLPEGYRPLAGVLEQGSARLGLWMPLMGTNLDIAWGEKQGYETAQGSHYYCLSSLKYNARLREVVRDHILGMGVSYFKHDFNYFRCNREGHAHLSEARYGFEANVDAEIEMLKYERSLRPEIFLNVTSAMWLSPWWLPYADAVWMGCGDFGFLKSIPAIERRDWAITYRDHHLWRRFRKERAQYPLTATMTHGVIYGRRNMLGGKNEPLDKWSDNVAWYFLRGMQMKELYVTPSLLSDNQWDILGRACRWATDNAPVLRHARMILGDPGKGEVYGFAARAGAVTFFGFRNPSIVTQTASVPASDLIGEKPARLKLLYPFKCDAGTLAPGGTVTQALGPNAIRIYRAKASGKIKDTRLAPEAFGPFRPAVKVMAKVEAATLTVSVTPLRYDLTSARLVLFLSNSGELNVRRAIKVLCDGKALPVGEVKLDNGSLLHGMIPTRACTIRVQPILENLAGPFQGNLKLSGWLLTDTPGLAGPIPETKGELACPYATRRRTGTSLSRTLILDLNSRRQTGLTEADLQQIQSALLHVLVFGSNSEKEYAGKPILLNGAEVAVAPANPRPLDAWQRKVVPIPADKLGLIQRENVLQFGNRGGDCYKIRDVALAVKLKNGKWVQTAFDSTVHSSVRNWKYAEGKIFSKHLSQAIHLNFE